MGKRHTGRKLAMQIMYQSIIRQHDFDTASRHLPMADYPQDTVDWALELGANTWAYREKADTLIEQYSVDWDLDRITAIDRVLLWMGFYEMNESETPNQVAVDEVIELAKDFSTEESASFINGILGAYLESKNV
jgi:N utilization substance protein B